MTETEQNDDPGAPKARRSLAARASRLLKDADRLLKSNGDAPPQEMAILQLEQAKVLAMLQLAEALRENRKA
jgi:hypothetical protein